jgi:hypothetical protein
MVILRLDRQNVAWIALAWTKLVAPGAREISYANGLPLFAPHIVWPEPCLSLAVDSLIEWKPT